jgi:acetyltransferase
MWRYSHNLDALYETPALTATAKIDRSHAEQIINRARKTQRTLLTEIESKRLLSPMEFRP